MPGLDLVLILLHVSCAKSFQSCLTLCHPRDCSPPGSPVHGILHARILELLYPSSGDLPNPEIETASLTAPALGGGFFTTRATWEVPYWWCFTGKLTIAVGI